MNCTIPERLDSFKSGDVSGKGVQTLWLSGLPIWIDRTATTDRWPYIEGNVLVMTTMGVGSKIFMCDECREIVGIDFKAGYWGNDMYETSVLYLHYRTV
jgi:hypothetical protein